MRWLKRAALVVLILAGLCFFTLRSVNGPVNRMHEAVQTGMTVREVLRTGTGWFSLNVSQEHEAAADDWPSVSFRPVNPDGVRATYSSVEGFIANKDYSFEDAERLLEARIRASGKSWTAVFYFVGSPTRRNLRVTFGADARVSKVPQVYWVE
jgi:hypothetical protein